MMLPPSPPKLPRPCLNSRIRADEDEPPRNCVRVKTLSEMG